MAASTPFFPPEVLREYGFLADGERGAVVGPRGEVVWMCAPRWDSDAVFAALLGGGGQYVVTPADRWFVWGGHYEPGSLMWRSRWVTSEGAIECREALAMPADPHCAVLLRRLEGVDRGAHVRILLDVRAAFGHRRLRDLRLREAGVWTGRAGEMYVRWTGAPEAAVADGCLELTLFLAPGDTHDLVLEISDRPLPGDAAPDPDRLWTETESEWHRSVPALSTSIAQRDARHAYAVLRGMTSGSGGMVAAATTSLPERAEAGRDYDYRYCWIRDQCYAGRAVAADGPHDLVDSAIRFVSERLHEDGADLRPAYTARGGRVPEIRTLDKLTGYPGGGKVVGNRIDAQFQLDAFGEALLLLAAGARHDRLDSVHWQAAEIAADAVRQRAEDAGAGIWELGPRRWAHSRLTCAAGLRAMAAVAPSAQGAAWVSLADGLVTRTTQDCLHPSGRWQRAPDDERVDASLLLSAIRGAVPAEDPRSLATLEAVRSDLVVDDFVYRFRHDARPLHDAEGAFLLCGFLSALALHQVGESTTARAHFERARSACGPAGLYSEEYDVVQRQLRGNLPQAFVHALMLECAVRLGRPWTDEHATPSS